MVGAATWLSVQNLSHCRCQCTDLVRNLVHSRGTRDIKERLDTISGTSDTAIGHFLGFRRLFAEKSAN